MATANDLQKKLKIKEIKRIPDPKRVNRYGRRSRGKTTGMGVNEYICALFELNERLPTKKKMTDEALKQQFMEEFPDRPSTQSLKDKKISMNYYRLKYNSGRFTKGNPPEIRSHRYDYDGRKL